MTPFTVLQAVACPLPYDNIDTDQIIPARFMRKPRSVGYGQFFLHDRRFDEAGAEIADFPLNLVPWRQARILVTGANWGCGSSREPAVYALKDFGIRAIIAPSFGDIHRSNAVKNGVLPVTLDRDAVERLSARLFEQPDLTVRIDLPEGTVECGELSFSFRIDSFSRECLLKGVDDIDLTLEHEAAIARMEDRLRLTQPWSVPLAAAGADVQA